MAGRVQWEAQVDSNVAKLLSETKELRDQLDGIKKGNYEIKLNIDDKKLEKVISNLDKMLESLGKGTGDFKEFENLSKQLNEIVSEVKELNKAFGGINDSGVSNLLSSIQSIDKSLSSLSEHITNVNKDFGSVGKNASDNVGHINEARKATEGLTEATKELANAQKNVGNKSNISSGNEVVESQNKIQSEVKETTDEYQKLFNLLSKLQEIQKRISSAPSTQFGNVDLWKCNQSLSANKYMSVEVAAKNIKSVYGEYTKSISNKKPIETQQAIYSQFGRLVEDYFREYGQYADEMLKNVLPKKMHTTIDDISKDVTSLNERLNTYASENVEQYGTKILSTAYENVKSQIASLGKDINVRTVTETFDEDDLGFDPITKTTSAMDDIVKIIPDAKTQWSSFDDILTQICKILGVEIPNSAQIADKSIQDVTMSSKDLSSSTPIKDTFQGDVKASAESSAPVVKEEATAMEQVAESAEKASKGKDKFAKANKKVKESADSSADSIEKETSALDEKEWDKNVKAIQEYMDANTKLNNLKAQDKGTGKKSSEIVYQTKEVERLEKVALEARAALSSMINPHEVPIDDWNKWLAAMKQFDQATEGSAESLAKLEDSLRNMAESQFKKVNDTLSNSEKYLELLKPTEGNRSVSFEKVVQEYDRAVNSLKEFHATLDASTPLTKEQSDKFGELAKKVKDARTEIDKIPKALRGSDEDSRMKEIDKLTKYLDANTRITKEAKRQLQGYLALLKSGDPSISVKELHTAWTKVAVAEREAGREGKRFIDILSDKALYGQAAQLAGYYLSLTDFIRYAGEGIQTIRELDTALTEMRKVSNETVSSLERFQDVSFDLADNVGTTAKQIQNSTASWMRLGEAMSEASESAQVSNILLNVSEFENIDEATESLVAMSQAYKDLEKIEIVDVLNKIGNEYSISTDGIATALQDSASALVTANNDLNEAVALITAGNAVTQDPNSVGTGMRTISLRLVGTEEAKAELEKLGEDVSDMVMTSSKVRETIMSATKAASKDGMGFDILDNNGNYKSTYEIMQGLADLYDEIVAKDKEFGTNNLNLLLETISGKNRANIAASILQNGDMLRNVFKDAQNATGSAQEELDKYLESIDGRMAKLENQAQEFWYKLIDSNTIKNGITLLTELLGLATDFVDTFGALGTAGIIGGGILGAKNLGKFA